MAQPEQISNRNAGADKGNHGNGAGEVRSATAMRNAGLELLARSWNIDPKNLISTLEGSNYHHAALAHRGGLMDALRKIQEIGRAIDREIIAGSQPMPTNGHVNPPDYPDYFG